MKINDLVKDAHARAMRKGFWPRWEVSKGEPAIDWSKVNLPEKLALVHSEVSEALECLRNGEISSSAPLLGTKPIGFPSELADIVIRVADICGALGIDLEAEIIQKSAYNETRPAKHGKAF